MNIQNKPYFNAVVVPLKSRIILFLLFLFYFIFLWRKFYVHRLSSAYFFLKKEQKTRENVSYCISSRVKMFDFSIFM